MVSLDDLGGSDSDYLHALNGSLIALLADGDESDDESGDDESDDAYELVLEWYDDKFDDSRGEDQQAWSLELLRMRFGATLLN
jgi:hypothetical protein